MAPPPARRSPGLDPRLTVHQLRRLVAVADHGSISAAAAALYLAQPALSKSLMELERTVGTRLFARTNRGTVLSPEGERAVRLARMILADVEAFEGLVDPGLAMIGGAGSTATPQEPSAPAVAGPAAGAASAGGPSDLPTPASPDAPPASPSARSGRMPHGAAAPRDSPAAPSARPHRLPHGAGAGTRAGQRGTTNTSPAGSAAPAPAILRIAATPTLSGDLGTHLIPAFAAEYPDTSVRLLRFSSRPDLFDAVRNGDADLGVAALPGPDDLVACRFAVREVVLVSPESVDLPDPASPAHLDGLPLVLPPPGPGRREEIDAFFTAMGVTPVVALEAEDRSAWVAAVRAGLGSVFLYRDMHEDLAHPGTTVRDFHPPVRGHIALFHRPDTPPPRIARFRAYARHHGLRPPLPGQSS
ncbi:LysR substrate-binding domain-containing protein [Uniformispora flossi]|uniref:LysR family transcriptional regulator n=1 Tax=Uniformispora flossi TaxID=3390723 RepID=UPI003C2AD78A